MNKETERALVIPFCDCCDEKPAITARIDPIDGLFFLCAFCDAEFIPSLEE
jgi:hypothetical protein